MASPTVAETCGQADRREGGISFMGLTSTEISYGLLGTGRWGVGGRGGGVGGRGLRRGVV